MYGDRICLYVRWWCKECSKSLQLWGVECEQQSRIVSVGLRINLSATLIDRGTRANRYCCCCQIIIKKKGKPRQRIQYLFQIFTHSSRGLIQTQTSIGSHWSHFYISLYEELINVSNFLSYLFNKLSLLLFVEYFPCWVKVMMRCEPIEIVIPFFNVLLLWEMS